MEDKIGVDFGFGADESAAVVVDRGGKVVQIATAARHSSGHADYGSPPEVVQLAREVMGGIALDPASSEEANRVVRAGRIYTPREDGFTKAWRAKSVFLNPPGGLTDARQRRVLPQCRVTGACGLPPGHAHEGVESSQKKWWWKLVDEWAADRAKQAVFLCFSVELLQTTQSGVEPGSSYLPLDFAVCYPRQRLRYVRGGVQRDQPPHASCVVYLPPAGRTEKAKARFERAFSGLGKVVVPR